MRINEDASCLRRLLLSWLLLRRRIHFPFHDHVGKGEVTSEVKLEAETSKFATNQIFINPIAPTNPIQPTNVQPIQLHHFLTWVGKLTKCDGALHDSTNQFKQKVLALPFDKMPVAAVLRPNSNGNTIKKSLPYKSASVSETQCHFSGDSKWQKSVRLLTWMLLNVAVRMPHPLHLPSCHESNK